MEKVTTVSALAVICAAFQDDRRKYSAVCGSRDLINRRLERLVYTNTSGYEKRKTLPE